MSDIPDSAKAKLEAAKLKAEQLRALQEEAAREIAEAEALEAAEIRKKEIAKAQQEKERLHRSSEKQRLLKERQQAAYAAREEAAARAKAGNTATADSSAITVAEEVHDFEDEDTFDDVPIAKPKSQRKRLGLRCFNCNRLEGHYLSYYRRVWYSFLVGMTFGLAIIFGPYKCQCCGSQRLMISNLLHPKYYAAISKTRSKSGSKKRRSSRR